MIAPAVYATDEPTPVTATASQPDKPAITPPKFISGSEPEYTETARRNNIEGTVILAVKINEKGKVTSVRVLNSLEKDLDKNAARAVKRWKFHPAMQNGQPVPAETNISVDFRIYR